MLLNVVMLYICTVCNTASVCKYVLYRRIRAKGKVLAAIRTKDGEHKESDSADPLEKRAYGCIRRIIAKWSAIIVNQSRYSTSSPSFFCETFECYLTSSMHHGSCKIVFGLWREKGSNSVEFYSSIYAELT